MVEVIAVEKRDDPSPRFPHATIARGGWPAAVRLVNHTNARVVAAQRSAMAPVRSVEPSSTITSSQSNVWATTERTASS
jgi:hypothetical protein